MAENLDDLFNFLDDDGGFDTPPLKSTAYPEGKVYRIQPPSALDGLRLSAIGEITTKLHARMEVTEADMRRLRLDDKRERDMMGQTIGEATLAEMIDDGVNWPRIQKLSQYMFIHWALGPESARKAVEAGVFSGKAPAAPTNREGRREQQRKPKRKG